MKIIRRNVAGETIDTREAPGAGEFSATVKPSSWHVDADGNRFVDIVLSDERTNTIRRVSWWSGQVRDIQLSMDDDAVRLGRLNAGAPFLRVHDGEDDTKQLGVFVDDSARVEGKVGERLLISTVRFSNNLDDESERIVADVKDGIRRNVSAGFKAHETVITERADGSEHHFITDWETHEGSLVPMNADPGAQTRAATTDRRPSAMPNKKDVQTFTLAEMEAAAEKRAAELVDKRAVALAETKVDEIQAAREARATDLRKLGRALTLKVARVDELIAERDVDGLMSYDAIVER